MDLDFKEALQKLTKATLFTEKLDVIKKVIFIK
jgi:hypothetical protein